MRLYARAQSRGGNFVCYRYNAVQCRTRYDVKRHNIIFIWCYMLFFVIWSEANGLVPRGGGPNNGVHTGRKFSYGKMRRRVKEVATTCLLDKVLVRRVEIPGVLIFYFFSGLFRL